jgi:type II secretory pathway component PulM
VLVAVIVALILTHRLRHLDPPERATLIERVLAVVLVLLWMAVISCGRWIAYS